MTKYKLTKALVDALMLLNKEATDLAAITIDNFNEAEVSDEEFNDIDITMTRLNVAWEDLKKTKKEEMTDNIDRFAFKAKNILGEWVYAELYEDEDGAGLGLAWKRPEGRFQFHPVIKKTICQCTGMKDSDGNLIYENDYVKIGKGKLVDIVYCVYRYEEYPFYFLGDDSGVEVPISTLELLIRNYKHKQVVVIGNKFDKEEMENDY